MVSAPCGIFLLQEHFVCSKVANVTGIVKYIRKRVFGTNPPKKLFLGGGYGSPPPPPLLLRRLCGGENPLCGSPFITYKFRWGAAKYIFSIESTAPYLYRLSL